MLDDSWTSYLEELLSFVKPVSGLIADFFASIFGNIPEADMLFQIAAGLIFMLIGLVIFFRLVNE